MSADWWRERHTCEVLLEEFRTRVLGLFLVFECGGKLEKTFYSGFPVRLENQLFWFTCAHVLKQVRGILKGSNCRVISVRWWDNGETRGAESVPVHDRDFDSFEFDEHYLDVGCVRLGDLDRINILRGGNLKPFSPFDWDFKDQSEAEGHYLLGWSGEDLFVDSERAQNSLTCLPVEELSFETHAEPGPFWSDPLGFYGALRPYSGVDKLPHIDVRGMSGGPILSVRRDRERGIVYRLAAIQRSWHKTKKFIRAERIEKVVGAI